MNTAPERTRDLKLALLDEYGNFSDRRIKNIDRGSLFIIDDRSSGDHGADGRLFPWFCLIFADVVNADTIKISMHGGIPKGTLVTQWCKKHKATKDATGIEFFPEATKGGSPHSQRHF